MIGCALIPSLTSLHSHLQTMSSNILNLGKDTFDSAINNATKPVLVDFWAPWCGPCKAIAPILDQLAGEMGDRMTIAKVNVQDDTDLAGRFGVRNIPTLLLFKGGQRVEQIVGLTSKADLTNRISRHL